MYDVTCMRSDGRIWAMGVSLSDDLHSELTHCGYGDDGQVLMDYEYAESWLDTWETNLYSIYPDADGSQFFPARSRELRAQYGLTKVFLGDGECMEALEEAIFQMLDAERLTLQPRFKHGVFKLQGLVAEQAGTFVERLTPEMMHAIQGRGFMLLDETDLPQNIYRGMFMAATDRVLIRKGDVVAEFPLKAEKLSQQERQAGVPEYRIH